MSIKQHPARSVNALSLPRRRAPLPCVIPRINGDLPGGLEAG